MLLKMEFSATGLVEVAKIGHGDHVNIDLIGCDKAINLFLLSILILIFLFHCE